MKMNETDTILIIEDDRSINKLLERFLATEGFRVLKSFNGRDGMDQFYKHKPDLVISDINMPYMNGFEVCKEIKSKEEFRLIPVILLTSRDDNQSKIIGIEAGADDFIVKPVNRFLLSARIKSLIKSKKLNEKLDNSWSLLFSLAKIIEAKDNYTEKHTIRVAQLAQELGQELGLSEEEKNTLIKGGVLHDIGKVGIPDKILTKKGKLTAAEYEIMKKHTEIGYEICQGLNSLREISAIIYSHHEKYDGSGYPQGLEKDEIPLLAQIISITDVYDALRSDRSYRKSYSLDQTLEIINRERGKSFNPALVDLFLGKVVNTG